LLGGAARTITFLKHFLEVVEELPRLCCRLLLDAMALRVVSERRPPRRRLDSAQSAVLVPGVEGDGSWRIFLGAVARVVMGVSGPRRSGLFAGELIGRVQGVSGSHTGVGLAGTVAGTIVGVGDAEGVAARAILA